MFAVETAFGKSRQIVEELIQFVDEAAAEEIRTDLVERELFRQLLQLGLELLRAYIARAGDGDVGDTVSHGGRILRRFSVKKTRLYRSIFGVVEVVRWVYGVREGQQATHVPLDARLGMPKDEQSYVLQDWLQRFCVQNAFSSSVNSIADLLGIKTSTRTAERLNRETARHVENYRRTQQQELAEDEGEILVATADGKGVPMRRTLEEQMGKPAPAWRRHQQKKQAHQASERATKRLGRGQVSSPKQMAYVGAVYTISPWIRTADDVLDELLRSENKPKRPRPKNKRVWAEMTRYQQNQRWEGQPRLFAGLAYEVYHRDPEKQKPLICLMDGQRSLWELKGGWISRAIGILDIFHATEWLWKAAYCFHAQGSRKAEEFVTHYLRMFLEGKVGYAIGSLRRKRRRLTKAKQGNLDSVLRYFENNQQYMKYDEYLQAGYPIGSGVVEGACRHLVRDRMERTGMRWDTNGAQAMLDTRSVFVNGQWDQFTEHRIQTEQSQLYAQSA